MTRWLVSLLLAALCSWSQAAPSCLPLLYGPQWPDAKEELGTRGQHGWFGYGWCKGEDGAPKGFYLACTHGLDCLSWDKIGIKLGDLAFQAVTGGKQAVYGAYWESITSQGDYCDNIVAGTPKANACAELRALMARDWPAYTPPVPPPPAPTYTHAVAPNPQSTATPPTRPSRQVVDGALKTMTKPVYVPVGTDCDTAALPTFASGSDVWAAVVGQAPDLRLALQGEVRGAS